MPPYLGTHAPSGGQCYEIVLLALTYTNFNYSKLKTKYALRVANPRAAGSWLSAGVSF